MGPAIRYLFRRIAYTPFLQGITEKLAAPINTAEAWDRALEGRQAPFMGKTFSVDTRNGLIATLLRHYAVKNPAVLDVGCAGGTLALALPRFSRYLGIDISPYAIEQAAKEIRKENVAFKASDVLDFKIESSNWDVVVFAEILYYLSVDDATKSVVRFADGLTKDGVIIVSMKDDGGKSRTIFKSLEKRFE